MMKMEPQEPDARSSAENSPDESSFNVCPTDLIPIHKTPKPKFQNNNSVKKEKNGFEKNGQKRIQTAPIDAIDGTSKKPRINTPEECNDDQDAAVDIKPKEVAAVVEPFSNKEAAGENRDLNNTVCEDKINLEQMDQANDADDAEEYYLTVHNLPTDWTYMQIKNYLDQQCGHVDEMEMLKHRKSKNCAIRLTFQKIDKCIDVFKKLENKFVYDKKLKVKISDTYTTFPTGVTIPTSLQDTMSLKHFTISNEIIAATRWRPDLDSYDKDPEGVYGLRPEFLNALGIKPPLKKMVHVTNFRCDKSELKEVMEMAGNVLMCSVVTITNKYAKVMYSHPLEAVQAISMLNGQLFYGSPLKIIMDNNPEDSVVLPKGLLNIGQGLGMRARPIRNIVQHYHRYANKQTSSINPIIFSEIDFTNVNINEVKDGNSEEIVAKIKEFLNSRPGCNIMNPTVHSRGENESKSPESMEASESTPEPAANTNSRGGKNNNVGSPQKQKSNSPQLAAPAFGSSPLHPFVQPSNPSGPGFMRPNMIMNPPMRNPVPMPGPREPFFRPGNPQEPVPFRPRVPFVSPSMQRPPFAQSRPPFGPPAAMRPQIPPSNFTGPRANIANCVNVMFSNLPPSTTFPLLCDLIAQCGQVMSVQLTTPGCAVATFGHPSHAERCFQSFNGFNLDGFIIKVTFT